MRHIRQDFDRFKAGALDPFKRFEQREMGIGVGGKGELHKLSLPLDTSRGSGGGEAAKKSNRSAVECWIMSAHG